MKVDRRLYRPMVSNGYEYVYPVDPDEFQTLFFDGRPRQGQWRPIVVRFGNGLAGSAARRSDFPWLSGLGLVLRPSAARALAPLIQRHAELLKLVGLDGSELYALNVTSVVDALDETRSKLSRGPDGQITLYKKVYFRDGVLNDLDLFKLPYRSSPTFVSDRFVDLSTRNSLVGLDYHLVWP